MSFPITAHHGGMSHQQAFTATTGILEHVLSLRRLLRLRAAGWGHLSNGNPTAGGCERNKPVAAPRELDAHFNSSHLISSCLPATQQLWGRGDQGTKPCTLVGQEFMGQCLYVAIRNTKQQSWDLEMYCWALPAIPFFSAFYGI